MKDNLSNFHSCQYDNGVRQVIPYYPLIHQEAVTIVRAMGFKPEKWLDTGCGTGHLVSESLLHFPECRYFLTDPASGMLEIAAERFSQESRVTLLDPLASNDLPDEFAEKMDVVSAMFCHHYQKSDEQYNSVAGCYRVLRTGGVFLTAGHCYSDSKTGTEVAVRAWRSFQMDKGRSTEDIDKHFSRLGDCLFPLTVQEYAKLLVEAGFHTVELFWRAGMQCAFFAIK